METSDPGILSRIGELVDEERDLRSPERERPLGEDQRLEQIEAELDQCWVLFNQRPALRELGEDPERARLRDCGTLSAMNRARAFAEAVSRCGSPPDLEVTMVNCSHLDTVREVSPSSEGCEDCLRIGGRWVHLRMCMRCGHVGCCDSSPNRHATAHHHENPDHPLVRSYEPDEEWWWCFPEQLLFEVEGAPPAPSHP